MLIKFTNLTYYTGGGKIPYRLRHNQNRRFRISDADKYTDEELINRLWYWTKGKYVTTVTTKVIRINHE